MKHNDDWDAKYTVGEYGELCSLRLMAQRDGKSPGYPVFKTYAYKPYIKHCIAWFIFEGDADEFAGIMNKILEE